MYCRGADRRNPKLRRPDQIVCYQGKINLSRPLFKAIFFFLSVFPQFIDPVKSYPIQFATLVLTYSALVVLFHCAYALFAKRAKGWLVSERGGRTVNKAAGATFVFFGAALATAKR